MLGENAIGDSQHVSGHPGHGSAIAGESAVYDHKIAFEQDYARLYLSVGGALLTTLKSPSRHGALCALCCT